MSTSSSPSTSTPLPQSKQAKMNKHTKVIILRLQPSLLSRFAPKATTRKESKVKPSPSATPQPHAATITEAPLASSTENASESNATPIPRIEEPINDDAPPPKKRKGPVPGSKRGLGQGVDSVGKPRGKPGPKKKPRLEDGTIDHTTKTPWTGPAPPGAHKLGPKANQGAINAGLRALDRSGKPCKKWERKPIQLKSFTGVVWELPSWRVPRSKTNGDESSDGRDISQQSASNSKANDSSTAADSNGADGADQMIMSTPAASSPAPVPAAIAVEG